MQAVIIHNHVKLAIEREVEKAIEAYPQLETEREAITKDMLKVFSETGEVAEIVAHQQGGK